MLRPCLFVLLFTLFSAGQISGQEISAKELATRIDAYVKPFVEADQLSGTFLVARDGKVIYERSWGLADRERKIGFDSNTPSCVASVNKPVTIIVTSRLIDQGHLALSDPISKWLKDFPQGDQIQVRHLLYHRSGIPHRLSKPDQENIPRTAADMVRLAAKTKLDFEPNLRRSYSSGGYSVLARVLELASGKSYEQLLNEIVFEPLRLKNTFHPGPKVDLSGAAHSYTWTGEGRKQAAQKDYSFLIGGGALFSTPRDLLAISQALVEGKFGDSARRQLLRLGKLKWNGITNHYRAYLNYDVKTKLTVVMVSNQMVGANDLLRIHVPKIVAGDEVATPVVPQPKKVKLSAEVLARYSGRYKIAGSPMEVRARGGALFANDWILIPTSNTTFFSPQDYSRISIELDDLGEPQALIWSGARYARIGPVDE